ncbi:MAG TPA: S41 family peptidase [Candidatus Saccharimonadales bacterium]|nr:S41 family peptidase [Candidatus Saccharimonadales bacterium]
MQKDKFNFAQKIGAKMTRNAWIGVGAAGMLIVFVLGVNVGNGTIPMAWARGSSQNGSLPTALDYSTVNQAYQAIKDNYDGKLTEQQLLDGLKSGLAQATGDPYTEYFNAKDAKAFNNQLQGTFSGIGAELGQDSDKNLVVIAPISGFPADKAGLRAQDIITSIDGKSTSGMSVDEAVNLIRGQKGTNVVLKIVRNKSDALTLTITRADIKVPSVNSKILDNGLGYMQITQFSDDTADLAAKAAQNFKDKNVKGVILDLRDDPGGLLDAAVKVSSLWLPQNKLILQEKTDGKVVNSYTADGNNTLAGIPTVVLVNGGSASAAEITAGALRDNNVATILGEKSYGKGSVQQIMNLSGGAEIKVTVARWYRPNGQNIDKKGITPDKTVKMTDDDYAKGNDPQKDAAISQLTGE